jgi:hypothetical protein
MTKLITTSIVLDLLEAAVEERGEDYVYQQNLPNHYLGGCLYLVEDKPGCIVGVVFDKLGVSHEAIGLMDQGTSYSGGGFSVTAEAVQEILGQDGFEFEDHEAIEILRTAQHVQDAGDTWGNALKDAHRTADRIEGRL